jgi:hypothetical protein
MRQQPAGSSASSGNKTKAGGVGGQSGASNKGDLKAAQGSKGRTGDAAPPASGSSSSSGKPAAKASLGSTPRLRLSSLPCPNSQFPAKSLCPNSYLWFLSLLIYLGHFANPAICRIGHLHLRAAEDKSYRGKVLPGNTMKGNGVTYQVDRIVGHGSFGVVFQATTIGTGEVVAIKKVLQDKRFKVCALSPGA